MNNDSKKRSRINKKKLTFTLVVIIVVLGLGTGVWWYFSDKAKKDAVATEQKRNNAKQEFTNLNIKGSTDRASQYLVLLDQGKNDEALSLYMNEVDKAKSKEEKVDILIELRNLAVEKNNYNHAISAAKKRIEIDPSIEAYQSLSIIYNSNNDLDNAIQTHKKLISLFDETYPPSELNDELKQQRDMYVQDLSTMEDFKVEKDNPDQVTE